MAGLDPDLMPSQARHADEVAQNVELAESSTDRFLRLRSE